MRKALVILPLVLTFGCGEETVVPANPPAQPAAATAPVPPVEEQQAKPKHELEPGETPPTM